MVAFSKLPVMMSDEDIVDERYKNGKIYLVKCKYDDELVYVGSTIQNLYDRMSGHRRDDTCSLYHFVNGDWDNWFIELYENYPCKNKYILQRREGEVQRQIATINKCIAGRSTKQWYDDNREILIEKQKQYYKDNLEKISERSREYYQNNREKIVEQKKQYAQNNRDKIAEYHKQFYQDNREKIKQYNQDNRDKIAEYHKQFYQDNREKILERQKQKITCERCGSISTKHHITRHKKSQKCLNYNVGNN
jgi:hypothetical protein